MWYFTILPDVGDQPGCWPILQADDLFPHLDDPSDGSGTNAMSAENPGGLAAQDVLILNAGAVHQFVGDL